MKKVLLVLAAILMNLSVSAKGIKVVSDLPVSVPDGEASYSPLMSPAGDYILLTSGSMEGLKKYDLSTGVLTTVTSDKGAGYNAKISEDGKIIVYRESVFKDRLRYTSVKCINLEDCETETVVRNSRYVAAFEIEKGTALALEKGKIKSKRMNGRKVKEPVMVSVQNGRLTVTRDEVTRVLSPCGDKHYLWQSLSPDREKILFAVPEKKGAVAYICDLYGGSLVRLGVMSAPVWMGNDWVVGMNDEDNGEFFTASVIVAVRATGEDYTILTDNSKISMYPSASADASKIVYNTADGKIFMLNVVTE